MIIHLPASHDEHFPPFTNDPCAREISIQQMGVWMRGQKFGSLTDRETKPVPGYIYHTTKKKDTLLHG